MARYGFYLSTDIKRKTKECIKWRKKNYLAVVRPAETDLDLVDALLLADLQEGGHTIENDLAEIVRGGKTDYSSNAMSESFKLTIGNVPGDKGIEAVKHAVQTGGQLRIWLMSVINVQTVNITECLVMLFQNHLKCRLMMKVTKSNCH